ncbi:MAG: hypothetical protein GY854_19170 [Deltaproteobacteria bacterium]|nr:hypothetical protein [Deltaproteobacteria bacterium]
MDASRPEIVAKTCYRNYPEYCAIVQFIPNDTGDIYLRPQYVQVKVEDDLDRWLIALEQTYSKYRCYTDETLRAELNKFGISFK